MSKIIKLQAQNVKRLSAVEITPDGNAVIIGGKNAQGKSSILDAIEYALAGKGSHCDRVVRDGEKGARVVVETDDLIITRRWTANGGTTLEVAGKDGRPYKSPQQVLDALCGSLTFDPIEFSRMKPKDQADALRSLVGIDTSDLDEERERVYADRTNVNRDAKRLLSLVESIDVPSDTPDEAPSIEESVKDLEQAQLSHRDLVRMKGERVRLQSEMEALKRKLKELEDTLKALDPAIQSLSARDWQSEIETHKAKIAQHDAISKAVSEKKAKARHQAELDALRTQSVEMSDRLADIDDEKSKRLQSIKFPVKGMSVDGDDITYNGIPLSQASSAEKIRVSMAMALAANPGLRVALIRDGAYLDEDSLAEVCRIAQEYDAQVWVERVGDGEECSIIIEDGAIK